MITEPKPGDYLPTEDFKSVVCLTPLVSIDIVARRDDGKVLLGRRKNEPAKGMFFVAGGRITKNETTQAAFRRLTLKELGAQREIDEARFLGQYEHIYSTNVFEAEGFGTHYVVLAYEINLPKQQEFPKTQHDEYRWMTEVDILSSVDVHENTKAYFRKQRIRSEAQYNVLAARRNSLNTMLWQTPALSLTALAFLLNVAGNKNAYLEIRVTTCLLALAVALFTLQLFTRHRRLEVRDSCRLEEFEKENAHLGYAPINARMISPGSRFWRKLNPSEWSSFKLWKILFVLFSIASICLLVLNISGIWNAETKQNAMPSNESIVPQEETASMRETMQPLGDDLILGSKPQTTLSLATPLQETNAAQIYTGSKTETATSDTVNDDTLTEGSEAESEDDDTADSSPSEN